MSESAVIIPAGETARLFDALPENRAAAPASNPETACVRKDFRRELALLMGQLPGREQAVIQTLYLQQKTPAEAAKELHYSPRGLRNARQRALSRLREKLTERFQNCGCKQILEELQWTK